ncbi:MAG: heparinase II/III domain-containing protein, partial [Armatimonadota bacterium]
AFIHEWPEARGWLDYVATAYWTTYPAWGGDDGGWAEGPSYWGAYMNFMLHFAVALRAATGADLLAKPFFANTPLYALYAAPPYHRLAPFGDGQHGRVELGSLMYWFSSALRDPVARWYADARNRGPSADIMGVVLADPSLTPRPPSGMPLSRSFPSIGLVAMHSALGEADNDVYLLFRSSPYGSYSHGHADQNTFAIEGYGEALAIASGYYPWYGSPHHEQWTRETKAKNGITVDGGQGQAKRSMRARGQIEAFATGSGYDYASGDATAAYGERLLRAVRRIVHVRPGVFVLYDDLAAPQPVTWEWWLHALSRMEVAPSGPGSSAGEVRIHEGRAGMIARYLEPGDLAFMQTDRFAVPPEDGRPNQWHVVASMRTQRPAAAFLVVLMPHRAGETADLPRVSRVEGEGALGVSLIWPDGRRDLVGFRRPGHAGPARLEGVEADAAAFAIGMMPGGARRWLVGQGRRLVMGEREFLAGPQERTVASP